jgi:hypothetical protein
MAFWLDKKDAVYFYEIYQRLDLSFEAHRRERRGFETRMTGASLPGPSQEDGDSEDQRWNLSDGSADPGTVAGQKKGVLAGADFPVCFRIDGAKAKFRAAERQIPDCSDQAFNRQSDRSACGVIGART